MQDHRAGPPDSQLQTEGKAEVPGGQVWYQVVGSEGRTPVVLIHGGPGGTHDYFEPLTALADERPLLLYDQLGSGWSDRPTDPALWRVSRSVDELDALRVHLGWPKIIVIGHSFGAAVAAEYARHNPEFVHAVVLISPFYSASRWTRDVRALIATLPASDQAAIHRHEALGSYWHPEYKAAAKAFQRRYLCRLVPAPASFQRSVDGCSRAIYETLWGPSEFFITGRLAQWERGAQIATLPHPLLVCCGRYDQCTADATASLARLNPSASFAVFEDCAHVPFLENTPDFLQVLRGFIRSYDLLRS